MRAKKRNSRPSRRTSLRRKRQMTALTLLAAALAVFILAGSYLAVRGYVTKVDKNVICHNVYIGNVNVSGMKKKEAAAALKNHLEEDKAVTLSVKVKDRKENVTLEELGLTVKNTDELIKEAVNYGKKGSMWNRYLKMKRLEDKKLVLEEQFALAKDSTKTVLNERILPLVKRAKDAGLSKTDSGFAITPEEEGNTVNTAKTTEKIENRLNKEWNHKGFSIKAVLKKEHPKITEEDLKQVKDELGSFSTDAGGGERWQNLKTGVGKLNGTVLMPGEELSVYNTTSPYDEEHGYVEAGAYENGQVVPAFGGGICQVSTTLYNALIYAEAEILQRSPHSMRVEYVEPSRDAAIAGDYLDLKFKNQYDAPIYIYGEIDADNQLRFIIYGKETRPENRSVEFESETLTTEEYGITYRENSEMSLGSMNYAGSPHTGMTAQLWKIVYEDGKEVSRDIFNTSSYEKSDEIIEVGTSCNSDAAADVVRKAIDSQDEGKINSAIGQAEAMLYGGSDDTGAEDSGTGNTDENE